MKLGLFIIQDHGLYEVFIIHLAEVLEYLVQLVLMGLEDWTAVFA